MYYKRGGYFGAVFRIVLVVLVALLAWWIIGQWATILQVLQDI